MKALGYVALLAALVFAQFIQAGELVLHAPEKSEDGSYILQLENIGSKHFSSLELYRSLNGGEYKLLATVPLFKAISQMVNRNGVYGYKIRGMFSDGSSEMSDPIFVEVYSRSIELQPELIKHHDQKAQQELTLGSR